MLSVSKSVEPNEEQKVLTSDVGQGITTSTERYLFRGFRYKQQKGKNKKSKRVLRSSKWPNPFEQRISLGTELIKTKALLRTHGRGSQVTFIIFRLVLCIVLISVEWVDLW